MVSEIGFGAEWMERHTAQECRAVLDRAEELGINILDCWMSNPEVRSSLGQALAGRRERWYIQGHVGSAWQDGQYVRTRDVDKCRAAFEDLLARLQTDYIDLGMIHFVDTESDWGTAMNGPFLDYVKELKAAGTIRHIGMSTHNPAMAKKAVEQQPCLRYAPVHRRPGYLLQLGQLPGGLGRHRPPAFRAVPFV